MFKINNTYFNTHQKLLIPTDKKPPAEKLPVEKPPPASEVELSDSKKMYPDFFENNTSFMIPYDPADLKPVETPIYQKNNNHVEVENKLK